MLEVRPHTGQCHSPLVRTARHPRRHTAVFTITDGGLGDDDLAADGDIVDQGGPGVPGAGDGATGIPTLSEWGLLLFAALLGLLGFRRACRAA